MASRCGPPLRSGGRREALRASLRRIPRLGARSPPPTRGREPAPCLRRRRCAARPCRRGGRARYQLPQLDELLPQRVASGKPRIPRIRVRRTEKFEDALAVSTRTNQPVRAIARQHLVAQLLVQREVVRKHLGGKKPLG